MNDATSETCMEMPKYNCHKQVHALKIKLVGVNEGDGHGLITPEDDGYGAFKVSAEYMAKHSPQHGGYYVRYKDGYESYSPAEAFEEGYSPAGAVGLQVAPEMIAKMQVSNVLSEGEGDDKTGESLTFTAVGKSEGYGEDGLDENNTYATWTPSASVEMYVTNPELFGKFAIGEECYVEFTKAAVDTQAESGIV